MEKVRVVTEFCNNFHTQNFINGCYTIVARQTKNSKLCDKIQGENTDYDKNECVSEATNNIKY